MKWNPSHDMLCGLTWEHLPVMWSAKWLGNLIHRCFNPNYSTISQRVFFISDFQFHCLNLNSFPLCTGYFEFTTFPNFCGGDATWIHVTRFAGGFDRRSLHGQRRISRAASCQTKQGASTTLKAYGCLGQKQYWFFIVKVSFYIFVRTVASSPFPNLQLGCSAQSDEVTEQGMSKQNGPSWKGQ